MSTEPTNQAEPASEAGVAVVAAPAPEQAPKQRSLAQRIRRGVVAAIIVSFGIAALGGITVLVSGSWSETAGRVLITTALTGLFSVAVLCGVTLVGKRVQWFGWVTVSVSLITLIHLLWQVWTEFEWSDHRFQFTSTLCILTAASAVISLLLLLVDDGRRPVQLLLYVTLGFFSLGVLLTLLAVWEVSFADTETYWRLTGVVWILAALGTVVLPVLSLLLKSRLSAASLARIEAAAREAGVTPDEFVSRLLP